MNNIIQCAIGAHKHGVTVTRPAWLYDYGMKLKIVGLELPTAYEVDFAHSKNETATRMVGDADGVDIPNALFESGTQILAWLYVHEDLNDGYTVYEIKIPLLQRPHVDGAEPTPAQQDAIDVAIAALNDAIERTSADVVESDANADRAENAAESADASATAANSSKINARGYANQAAQFAQSAQSSASTATAQAQAAASSAGSAANAASSAANSAEAAETARQQAESEKKAAQTARTGAERAETNAGGSASAAANSASNAALSAGSAAQSAGQAAQSVASASGYADNAQTSATAAAGSATSAAGSASSAASANTAAQQAKTDAETAKTDAETAARNAEEWASQVDPDNLAHIDGSYPDMTVGNAEQLVSTLFVEDTEPYNFRKAGGSHDIGNREYDEIVGGSLPWNQQFASDGMTYGTVPTAVDAENIDNGFRVTANMDIARSQTDSTVFRFYFGTGKPRKLINGHKYFWRYDLDGTMTMNAWYVYDGGGNHSFGSIFRTLKQGIYECPYDYEGNAHMRLYVRRLTGNVGDYLEFKNYMAIDLTLMFGSTIADYIYSLETAIAGAGVAWVRRYLPNDYYSYNPGSMESVQVSAHRMVGFNAYNPATGTAKVLGGMQYQITGAYTALAIDGAAIAPDSDGIFTPGKNGTLTVTGGDSTTTCVHLVHSGYRNGEYEPYVEHVYPLDSSLTLRGILKPDENDKLYFDGDIYSADGTVQRRAAERAYQSGDESLANAITDGTTTVYLLDTPTTETADPFQSPQIVDDFGTEEYVDAGFAAGTRDFAFPIGHDTKYPPNLRDKLQHLPSSAADDGRYVIQQTDGNMVLMLDTSPVQIAALAVKVPDPPTADGTYRLTVTMTDGIPAYSWVQA